MINAKQLTQRSTLTLQKSDNQLLLHRPPNLAHYQLWHRELLSNPYSSLTLSSHPISAKILQSSTRCLLTRRFPSFLPSLTWVVVVIRCSHQTRSRCCRRIFHVPVLNSSRQAGKQAGSQPGRQLHTFRHAPVIMARCSRPNPPTCSSCWQPARQQTTGRRQRQS